MVKTFPKFQPSSAGSYKMYEESIITNINAILPTLSTISSKNKVLEITSVNDLVFKE